MAEAYEYLVGGIICLIISGIAAVIQNKISPPSLVAFGLFIFGVYKAIQVNKKEE